MIPIAHARNLQSKGLLETDARRRILDEVGTRPGATLTRVAAAVELSTSTTAYHLQLLEGAGLLRRLRDGREVRWFTPAAFQDPAVRFASILARPHTAALLRLLERDSEQGPTALARALGVCVPTVMWHLGKLESTGLVSLAREKGRVQVRVDPRLFAILDAQRG